MLIYLLLKADDADPIKAIAKNDYGSMDLLSISVETFSSCPLDVLSIPSPKHYNSVLTAIPSHEHVYSHVRTWHSSPNCMLIKMR